MRFCYDCSYLQEYEELPVFQQGCDPATEGIRLIQDSIFVRRTSFMTQISVFPEDLTTVTLINSGFSLTQNIAYFTQKINLGSKK